MPADSTSHRGQPGDGCQDPRDLHCHRCAACGFERTFSRAMCRALPVVPHCEMCAASEWRYEIDYLDGSEDVPNAG